MPGTVLYLVSPDCETAVGEAAWSSPSGSLSVTPRGVCAQWVGRAEETGLPPSATPFHGLSVFTPSLELVLGRAPAVLRNTESWLLNSISASRAMLHLAWKFKCVLLTSGRPNPMSDVLRRKMFPLIIFLVEFFHSHLLVFSRRICCYSSVCSWF